MQKKRAKFKFGFKARSCFKSNIYICLNKIFRTNKNIQTASLYSPINNEVSPFEFINYFKEKNIIISLPVVDNKNKFMFFKKWEPSDELIQGPLGNLEPLKNQKTILPQIVVVPMLSFDRELYRLGYGGGYYDKSIKFLKNYFKNEKKIFITIGLAYSIQENEKIPRENHDMNLDYIITENEVLCKF